MELLQFQHSIIQPGRIKVRIGLQGCFDVLVAKTFGYQQNGNVHVDQQTCMAVPQVMDPYLLYAGERTAPLHFVVEEVLGVWEKPVGLFQAIHGVGITAEQVCQERRYLNGADALFGFGTGYNILLTESGISFVDVDFQALKVYVFESQGESFTGTHTCPK